MALYNHGRSHPPKTDRRRRVYAWAVLVLCVLLAPLLAIGAVQSWARLPDELGAALILTVVSAVTVLGAGAALTILVRRP